MMAGLGPRDAGVILPEGGLFRPDELRRAQAELAETAPHRKAGELRHLIRSARGDARDARRRAGRRRRRVAHVGFERLADPWTAWRGAAQATTGRLAR